MINPAHFWTPYAFVRIFIVFTAGILVGIYHPDLIGKNVLRLILFLFVTAYFAAFFIQRSKRRGDVGWIGLLAVLLAGYLNVVSNTHSLDDDHVFQLTAKVTCYQAVVGAHIQEKGSSWKVSAKMTHASTSDGWKHCTGNIVLYLPKKDFQAPFAYGDLLLINGAPAEVSRPSNPGEFDYKRFLRLQNIHHQHFLRKSDVVLLAQTATNTVLRNSLHVRSWALEAIRRHIDGPQQQAVAAALLLGVKDGLESELVAAYSASGAMHVLAVSGLHVGIFYFIIALVLRPLRVSKKGRVLFVMLCISGLWAYAFITGLSPSVLRAVTMFTFVSIGQALNQRTNIYNTLGISAFLLLLIDPFLILSVGFQLSYIAVFGIVYLQRPIYLAIETRSWIMDIIWKISAVSIAAQIATFPLGLYYFNQFPNYFLISNLFVIPLAFVILVAGIALLVSTVVPVLAAFIGQVLSWTIKILNFLVSGIDDLPHSVTSDVHLTFFETVVVMAGISCVVLLFEFKRISYLYFAFVFTALFFTSQWVGYLSAVEQKVFTVYRIQGKSAYDLSHRTVVYCFADSAFFEDTSKIGFHVQPNRIEARIKRVAHGDQFRAVYPTSFGRVIVWHGVKLIHIQKPLSGFMPAMHADYVIVSNNALRKSAEIPPQWNAKVVILDSSNSMATCEDFVRETPRGNFRIYSVLHSGAFQKILD